MIRKSKTVVVYKVAMDACRNESELRRLSQSRIRAALPRGVKTWDVVASYEDSLNRCFEFFVEYDRVVRKGLAVGRLGVQPHKGRFYHQPPGDES